jgi:hypothetical protein
MPLRSRLRRVTQIAPCFASGKVGRGVGSCLVAYLGTAPARGLYPETSQVSAPNHLITPGARMLGTDPDGGREPFGAAQGRLWGVKARRPLLSWRHKFRERPVCPRVSPEFPRPVDPLPTTSKGRMVAFNTSRPSAALIPVQRLDHLQPPAGAPRLSPRFPAIQWVAWSV